MEKNLHGGHLDWMMMLLQEILTRIFFSIAEYGHFFQIDNWRQRRFTPF